MGALSAVEFAERAPTRRASARKCAAERGDLPRKRERLRKTHRPICFRHAAKSTCVCSSVGIEPDDRAAFADLLGDKILERGHLEGFIGDLVGEMRGDHDHAVAVTENDVAGKYRGVAAADRARSSRSPDAA